MPQLIVFSILAAVAAAGEEYEIGGPLAGVKLPAYTTQHGGPAGYPGSLPEKTAVAEEVKDAQLTYRTWGPQGQAPELELYPGAVEHYRAYMFKYMPIRSFFDRQSQVKTFVAPRIRGAGAAHVERYAEPVYWVPRHAPVVNTGKKREPVPVIRCRPGNPVLSLDLGELEPGLYAVRVIGAVETRELRPFRKSLVIRMRINDGPGGEERMYRVRAGYCDEFYSVAEIYFHAPRKRTYCAGVTVDRESEVALLVHTVSLDDALAGTLRRPIKKRSINGPVEVDRKSRLSREARLSRDDRIWHSFPPLNLQPSGSPFAQSGHHGHFPREVTFGAEGKDPQDIQARYGAWTPGEGRTLLVNKKLDLVYTVDDFLGGRPLPDPYPYKDAGCGLLFPHAEDPGRGQIWCPLAHVADKAYRRIPIADGKGSDAARDAVVALLRYAYQFPSIEYGNLLCSVVRNPGAYGRDLSCRRRGTAAMFLDHYARYGELANAYDRLFPFIKGNEDLARSIRRFVPWVVSSEDLVQLCDVYLLQTLAKRIMRYHYHTDPLVIARCATVLGDRSVTDDWMAFLFNRTFIYPLPPSGIQDAMITGCERDGCEYVGSTFYAQGEGASRVAAGLEDYRRHGGNPRYDLSDPARYPKPRAHELWHRRIVVAGGDFLRIGDVTGPDKRPGQFGTNTGQLPSRVLPAWAAILEGGREHADRGLKHAAYLRIGLGYGHHHHDSLDLQLVAYGQPMTIDGGQRPGYSSPGDRATRVHNLVQVDGARSWCHSWVTNLTDARGAPYVGARMVPPGGANFYRRQLALISLGDPGEEPDPRCYAFDVVRVSGGEKHVHCFHGLVNDSFEWNLEDERPARDDPFLKPFSRSPETHYTGTAPALLQATWRQIREKRGRGYGSEAGWGTATGPRTFTRLHLFDVAGAAAFRADAVCHKWGYQYTCSLVRRQGTDLESVFPALVEPYRGEPFITGRKLLAVTPNERDARRAVAVEISLKNGTTDWCFADGRPERVRRVDPLTVAGEFVYYSTDGGGLRQVTLSGGTIVESPDVKLSLASGMRTGKVVRVDYAKRRLWIDTKWPAREGERAFEIGVAGRKTTYTASRWASAGEGTVLTVTHGADYFRSRVTDVNPADGTVTCALGIALGRKPGLEKNWVASDEKATRFWRADFLGDGRFRLKGAPVSWDAFGNARVLRLWEYGVGDTVRQPTFASLRRVRKGVYRLEADGEVSVVLRGKLAGCRIEEEN